MSLESIIQYEITDPLHIKAIKLCMLWEKIMDHELPGYHRYRMGKGDPRKCLLFKHCLKLARETVGLIADTDYRYYIFAQIFELKQCTDGTVHALVEPNCLHGEAAWNRWQRWKKKFDRASKKVEVASETASISENQNNVAVEFRKTKQFLENQLGENYSQDQLLAAMKNRDFVKWVSFQKISPYYLLLSPTVNSAYKNLDDTFSFEPDLLRKSITPSLEADFKKLFPNEFV
jgi:hypothetical protein